MASAAQVFAIPELLEMILLRLPERDLLLSQHVNTTWRNLTKTSPHLQRKLWYKADFCDLASISDINWNPLKSSILKMEIGTSESTEASWNDMFLTQPAVSEIHVAFLRNYLRNEQLLVADLVHSQLLGTVKNPNGVTMGDFRSTDWVDTAVAARCAGGKSTVVRLRVYKKLPEGGLCKVSWSTFMDLI